ncbi:hypothetical protein TNCT_513011 [Trichonephila clavata]|uniref:Uncharacterized protein n=1 Tax=Trichonephila clavata TaxID=2740835 RepID=A0A8X6GC03_TRICU|nr:hypothetical protein TNCT_513011 [Trichonephila clavata]
MMFFEEISQKDLCRLLRKSTPPRVKQSFLMTHEEEIGAIYQGQFQIYKAGKFTDRLQNPLTDHQSVVGNVTLVTCNNFCFVHYLDGENMLMREPILYHRKKGKKKKERSQQRESCLL